MNEQEVAIGVCAVELAQEVPSLVDFGDGPGTLLQAFAGPINGAQGDGIEAFGIKQRGLIVVAKDGYLATTNHVIETFARIGSVSDDITQAKDLSNPLALNIRQDDAKGLVVGVNVTYKGTLHARNLAIGDRH